MFVHAMGSRLTMYKKGSTTAISGYLARRLNQGTQNVYSGVNGIQMTDGGLIVATQYGSAGFDSRCLVNIPFNFHHMTNSELKEKFGKHPRFDEI